MWYPAKVTDPATAEPVTLDEVKRRLRIDFEDDDADIELMIASARDHAEKYCNVRFASQTVEMKCDGFCDLDRLPEAPVSSVTSISYVDTDGAAQTLATSVYELRADALEAAIVTKYGEQWPPIRLGSRITVTAVVGYAEAPPAVKHAILLFIADAYEARENAKIEDWTALDALLCNYRRGA
ncbi:head-tail connector protein [Rhizobium mongolense]|uniref:Putative phiE125 gp8 family phage protein n=1 Tax=Rhizobium mongolense TaxID=57676 RepID=A0A7W6RI27_9HYPH|nr:head-tail connector protein [Rhizobium mongolense]MBB4272784.1 putative phiE125 gp8 family phage protein [Rhizobium mongolense]